MKRKQLTLFLEESESTVIESIRKRFNPRQYELIKSHITLCREDEIEDLERIQGNLERLEMDAFELSINEVKRFSKGKGVFIAIADREKQFRKLRKIILQDGHSLPRAHEAHITLMHPRNSTCTDDLFREIQKYELPKKLTIRKISLIEQEMGKKWHTLMEYELKKSCKC
ncbi:MAG: 2'-5' RNA ligase family protein [Bacteroidota bacterium]